MSNLVHDFWASICTEENYAELKPEFTEDEAKLIADYNACGVKKRLVIFYRPFAGNELYFKNEKHHLIHHPLQFYTSEFVYFTNIDPDEKEIDGFVLFDSEVKIFGEISVTNRLTLSGDTNSLLLFDEYSLVLFNQKKAGSYNSAETTF